MSNLYAFSLGREWKLSLAELFALFGEGAYETHSEEIALFHIEEEEKGLIAKFRNIGGSIRMMRVISETDEKRFPTDIITHIGKPDGKYTFALGSYGVEFRSSDIGLRIKKTLSELGISARLANTENKNLNAAAWKNERLGKSKSEYNLIKLGAEYHIAITLACQDIDAYARRDLGKSRDMVVGMMPPKLVQMMINLATQDRKQLSGSSYQRGKSESDIGYLISDISLYDPFCGLGTTLIEGANMGYTSLLGSDLSGDMVSATEKSMEAYVKEEKLWQDRIRTAGGTPARDVEKMKWKVWQMDASKIQSCAEPISHTLIVSEGYLGEIMQKESITLDRVKSERAKLAKMYDGFFSGLAHILSGNSQKQEVRGRKNFSKGVYNDINEGEKLLSDDKVRSFSEFSIVMSFPFWNIHDTYSYFTEVYDIIEKYGFKVSPLLPSHMKLNTMKGSLLYRRESQIVGREIIKIQRK